MSTKTFTFPASQVWISRNQLRHTITTGQTFALDMTDDGSTAHYTGLVTTAEVTLVDGLKIHLVGDPAKTYMNVTADTNVNNAGSLWFKDVDDSEIEIKIKNVDLDDADVPTTATFILEQAENPNIGMTWTSMTVA